MHDPLPTTAARRCVHCGHVHGRARLPRLERLRAMPICDLTRAESDELTRLLDLECAIAEAHRIERETGVNPLAMGCAGDD